MKDFDIGVYNQEAYIARTRREFHQLISEERMYYYFQPIFSAQTGRVHAYEALMRSDLPTLRSPATIMKLAREQGALYEIERLTFRKALEEFDNLRSKISWTGRPDLHQLHCQRLPAPGGQRVYGPALARAAPPDGH